MAVFGAPGVNESFLFSAHMLEAVVYNSIKPDGTLLTVDFEETDDLLKGTIVIRFSQSLRWGGESSIIKFAVRGEKSEEE